jgi:hypothetical protein
VSSDAEALRNSVMKSVAAEWDKQIEIGVGWVTLTVARLGLAFVDLPPEARTALRAVRGAEVGVYHRRGTGARWDAAALLAAADQAMNSRGWDRLVTVLKEHEGVLVYVLGNSQSPRNMKTCVVVLNQHDMVVATARADLQPLMQLASVAHHEGGPVSGHASGHASGHVLR